MNKIVIVVFGMLLMFGAVGCRHTVDYSQYPEVKYSTDVSPVISANCTQSGCHGSVDVRRFPLLTYDDLIEHTHVVSGKPEQSDLFSVIRTLNKNERMPVDPLPPLTDDQIKMIYLWIAQGAKNN